MRLTWLTGMLIFSLALNAAVLVTVGYKHFNQPVESSRMPCAFGDGHLYQRLGLDDSQLKRIEPIAHAFHFRIAELKSSMDSKRDRLISLIHREDNPEKLRELRTQMASTQESIQTEVIAHIAEIKKVLNQQQQDQFFALMDQSMNCSGTTLTSPGGGKR
jgi:Spy/CpxP family protein refolding chaperone